MKEIFDVVHKPFGYLSQGYHPAPRLSTGILYLFERFIAYYVLRWSAASIGLVVLFYVPSISGGHGRCYCLEEGIPRERILEKLQRRFQLTESEAEE